MRIEAIRARELGMRLKRPFETSFGVTYQRRILLVEVQTDEGVGWGEVTAGEGPFYNAETTDTAWLMLRQFVAPLVLGREFTGPEEVGAAMRPIRGHEMAKAAVETAAWMVVAERRGEPLWRVLGGVREEIACGVSLGIHADEGALLETVARELQAGYRRVKLKIKPGKDVGFVRAVRERYPEVALTVDANSAYSLADAGLLQELDAFGLDYVEQPLAWDEIYQHAELQRALRTRICLDECLHGVRDVEAALALGACGVVNVKLGRVGGYSEARRIEATCRERGVPVWCGGMLESGVGRMHNVALSSLAGFSLPGDVSASERYWADDIVEPEVRVSAAGMIRMPEASGLGVALRHDLIARLTQRDEVWLPDEAERA